MSSHGGGPWGVPNRSSEDPPGCGTLLVVMLILLLGVSLLLAYVYSR